MRLALARLYHVDATMKSAVSGSRHPEGILE